MRARASSAAVLLVFDTSRTPYRSNQINHQFEHPTNDDAAATRHLDARVARRRARGPARARLAVGRALETIARATDARRTERRRARGVAATIERTRDAGRAQWDARAMATRWRRARRTGRCARRATATTGATTRGGERRRARDGGARSGRRRRSRRSRSGRARWWVIQARSRRGEGRRERWARGRGRRSSARRWERGR